MRITSAFEPLPPDAVERALRGLPAADGYAVHVKPLRYRERPHLSAWTDFDERTITLQVPEPFFPFGEVVAYAAKRRPGPRMRFIWLTEGVTFRTPREVLGRKSAAETACDRFALRNFRRREVTDADAAEALSRRGSRP